MAGMLYSDTLILLHGNTFSSCTGLTAAENMGFPPMQLRAEFDLLVFRKVETDPLLSIRHVKREAHCQQFQYYYTYSGTNWSF